MRGPCAILACLSAAWLWLAPVAASDTAENTGLAAAQLRYRIGQFIEAAEIAERIGGVEGLLLAARATQVQAIHLDPADRRRGRLGEVLRLARACLARDPLKVEAHLQIAIALGRLARQEGVLLAQFNGRPGEARRHIDIALGLKPNDAWVQATFAGWHTVILNVAGATLGEELYGARQSVAEAAFAKAVELEPDNPLLRFEVARGRLLLDLGGHRDQVLATLSDLANAASADALEAIVREKGARPGRRPGTA